MRTQDTTNASVGLKMIRRESPIKILTVYVYDDEYKDYVSMSSINLLPSIIICELESFKESYLSGHVALEDGTQYVKLEGTEWSKITNQAIG